METDKTQGNSDTAKVTYDRNIKVAIVIGSFALFALIWLPTFFTVFTERVPEARADEVAVSDIDEAEIEVAVLRTGEGRRAGVGDVVRLNFIQQIGDEVIDTTYPTGSHPSGRGPVPHLLGTNDGSGNELFALIQAAFNKALGRSTSRWGIHGVHSGRAIYCHYSHRNCRISSLMRREKISMNQ